MAKDFMTVSLLLFSGRDVDGGHDCDKINEGGS
jgi:hypothetical protein